MKYIDLFAGVGGFRYGIERAFDIKQSQRIQQGFDHENSADSGNKSLDTKPLCVYSNEWDKYANSVYRRNFQECDQRDIRTVVASEIPEFDLLVGGFPCQSFSVAGLRRGFTDTRGTLFFEIARIVEQRQPRLLLLENVKGLLSHDQGQTFRIILSTLEELGYDCQWQVLNSKDFGVPQNRERVFIVGHLRGTPRPQVFPITGDNEEATFGTLTSVYHKGQHTGSYVATPKIGTLRTHKDGNGFREMSSNLSPTIPARARNDGSGQPVIAIPVLTPDRLKKSQNGRRFKEEGDPSFTLTRQDLHGVFDGMKIRRLTPVECERLQGFPDNWTKFGADGSLISDTQRYKMMGNAVTTNVITEIVLRLF